MGKIVAVVSEQKEKIGGGAPIFIAASSEERQQLAFSLEKILNAAAHELVGGLFIIVDHKE